MRNDDMHHVVDLISACSFAIFMLIVVIAFGITVAMNLASDDTVSFCYVGADGDEYHLQGNIYWESDRHIGKSKNFSDVVAMAKAYGCELK